MARLSSFLLVVFFSGIAGIGVAGPAVEIDFHDRFEERCLSCHGHSGPFIRDHVSLDDGILVGSHGQPLNEFLGHHAGGLSDTEMPLFFDVFQKQIEADGLFGSNCRFCHDRAKEFTRLNLVIRDDTLVGRYSGHDISSFLIGHARLSEQEAARMSEALRAILKGVR